MDLRSSLMRLVTCGVAFGLLAAPCLAQLDLPSGGDRRPSRGRSRSTERAGVELPRMTRGDLAPGARSRGELDLPGGMRPAGVVEPAPAEVAPAPDVAATLIFDELTRMRDPDAPAALDAEARLMGLGVPGLAAARSSIASERTAVVVIASRLLLASGEVDDRLAVVERLQQALPTPAAAPLLRALLQRDPMLASPAFLTSLLDHPSRGMRAAAARELADRLDRSVVPYLAARLQSKRDDTRWHAVQLLGRSDDPSVVHLLLAQLGDRKGKVAGEAARILAASNDERVDGLLLEQAFRESAEDFPMGRAEAFALLSLVEREDRRNVSLIDAARVPALLDELDSPLEIAAGTSAAALAGIGFRSASTADSRWLDLIVPHQLVRLASGAVFHRDFGVLQPTALRRLALIAGLSFGGDGPAWQRWWTDVAGDFRARRAVMDVGPGDEVTLALLRRDDRNVVRLAGPAAPQDAAYEGDRILLTDAEIHALVELLRQEGVFGVERLPARADRMAYGHSLTVSIADQSKRFEFAGELPPWFARIEGGIAAVVERNRWQRYRDPRAHPTQSEFWDDEHTFWDGDASPGERTRRLKGLVLAYLLAVEPDARDQALDELTSILNDESAATTADIPALLELLRDETFYGQRAATLVELALASLAGAEGESAVEGQAALLDALVAGFGAKALPALIRVLSCEASGAAAPAFAAAVDPRPVLRCAAASVLAADAAPDALELCTSLLADPDESVERAAIAALGERERAGALTELLVRARVAPPAIRAEALLAVGRIGGDGVRDVLLLGLASEDLRVQHGAVRGLAELADPGSAGLLASVFARGRSSPLFEPARAGLLRLGAEAHSELLRIAYAPSGHARRDAALLLAEAGVAEVASTLISILTDQPGDVRVAAELAILSGADLRGAEDPVQAWWDWWDLVVHDDSLTWIRGAAERVGISAPPADAFAPEITLSGALFFLKLARCDRSHLAERGRRELGRLLDRDIEPLQALGRSDDEGVAARAADLERELRLRWQAR